MIDPIATSTGGNAGGTSMEITKPTGTTLGDVLVAVLEHSNSQRQVTAPAGWVLVESPHDAATGQQALLYYKVAGASEPASYTFTFNAGSWADIVMSSFRGVDQTAPVADSAGVNGDRIAPSVSASRRNSLLLCTWGYKGGDFGWVPPGSMTERGESNVSSISRVMLATEPLTETGATGTRTATGGGTPTQTTSLVLTAANNPPNAPIATSPADGASVNRLNPIPLKATFSDPDAGDTPSASQWRYKLTTAATWTLVEQGNPLQSYSIPAGLAAGNYEWQAAYADQDGKWGPFCSSEFFTAADPPPGPTWLDPIDGQTITASSYAGRISIADLDKSEWTLHAENAGAIGAVLQGPVLKTTGDLRTHTFTGLVNDTPVWWSVRIEDAGLWTDPVQIRTPVSFTPPPDPTLVVALADDIGGNTVTITNPTPGAGEPAVAYNDIYVRTADYSECTDPHRPYSESGTRIAFAKPVDSTFIDWRPASGVAYEYRAVAVAANGTTSDSGWVPLDPNAEPTIHYGGAY